MRSVYETCQLVFRPLIDFSFGRAFTYAGIRIVVASENPLVIEELCAYLPELSEVGKGSPFEISFIINPEIEAEIRKYCSYGPEIQSKEDLFYSIRRAKEYICYANTFGADCDRHVLVKCGQRICIVSASDGEGAIRTPLRIFREVLLRQLENSGGILVHAAAVKLKDSGGVLIVGDAKAGKTSSMCQLVLKAGADYISNDRCILYKDGEDIKCVGWPFAIRLGVGFLDDIGLLQLSDVEGLRRSQSPNLLMHENKKSGAFEWGSTEKIELTPREFCEKFSCNYAEAVTLQSVLFPQLTPDGARMVVSLASEKTFETLDNNIYEPLDPDFLRGWLGIRSISDEEILNNSMLIVKELKKLKALTITGDPRGDVFPAHVFE
ncbi:TPA: hypothetical protein ACNIFG_003070 [Acinetobacter baumannii]